MSDVDDVKSEAGNPTHHLRLEWPDHHVRMNDLVRNLCGTTELTDIMLACRGGMTFHAHKLILAGASQHFRNVFQQLDPVRQPVLYLSDVSPSEMEYLLQFIYQGETTLPERDLERVLKLAKRLGIMGINAASKNVAEEDNYDDDAPLSRKRKIELSKLRNKPSCSKSRKIKSSNKSQKDDDDFFGAFDVGMDDSDFEHVQDSDGNYDNNDSIDNETPVTPVPIGKVTVKREQNEETETENKDCQDFLGDQPIEVLRKSAGSNVAYGGYLYRKNIQGPARVDKEKVSWICVVKDCNAMLTTGHRYMEMKFGTPQGQHNHPNDDREVYKMKILTELKDRVISSNPDLDINHIVDDVLSNYPPNTIKLFGSKKNLNHQMRNIRKRNEWNKKRNQFFANS